MIEADIDYPNEDPWILTYGIQYDAKAEVNAEEKWGGQGYYSISASVRSWLPVYEGNEWNRSCDEDITNSDFIEWPGDAALAMGRSTVESALGGCSATAHP